MLAMPISAAFCEGSREHAVYVGESRRRREPHLKCVIQDRLLHVCACQMQTDIKAQRDDALGQLQAGLLGAAAGAPRHGEP